MKHTPVIVCAILLLIALVATGCGSSLTKISKIQQDPTGYSGKTVEIAGVVAKSYGVDLVISEAGAYQVDDGTGKIWVTSNVGEPTEGTKVWVKGNVAKGFKLMGTTFGVVIRETERKTK